MAHTRTGLAALLLAGALALSACGTAPGAANAPTAATRTVQVTDNNGAHTVTVPPASVVALDNRTFESLHAWGVELAAAPRALMPSTIGYADDESIVDIGNHREPNLEAVVAADPDLIVNGQRFSTYFDELDKLVPDATQLLLEPREGERLDSELKRQTTELGRVFGKDTEATALNVGFDASVQAVKAAYTQGEKVMAVNVSGGNIGYIAPTVGRTLGPVFDMFGFTPALEIEGASNDHQGDDISVEAIAASNPDWILVMDRDAAILATDPSFVPANTVLERSEALRNVTAIAKGNVVYMPADTYTNEGIQTYTEFFNELARAMAGARAE